MTYQLEKRVWTDADFDKMGWHDNQIHQIRLTEDLEMDIDYICKWNEPDLAGLSFTFWVAPATLVFKKVKELTFEFDLGLERSFEIDYIERENNNQWAIITQQGDLQFTCDGFIQFIRQDPSFQFRQTIPYLERNGYSMDRITDQENPYLLQDDIVAKRKQDEEHYEIVKKRHLKKQELANLSHLRDNNQIDTKAYLIKKKEINELLYSYDFFLKGTQFESW
jgi:hypothetical protein